MKITNTVYKNVAAVCLETAKYRMTVLPSEGGKIVSFAVGEREFLWQNPAPIYGHIGLYDSYVEGECSSFDDMFPTIDPITLDFGSRAGVEYPDHGEVCRMPFSCEITGDGIVMEMMSARLGYTYKKTVGERESGEICVRYEITNTSEDDFSCLWAGHCMINVCEDGEVLVPFADGDRGEIMFDDNAVFGVRGTCREISHEMRVTRTDAVSKNAFKYYYTDKACRGEIGYRYSDGTEFWLTYDKNALPYIGVWVNNGSFKDSYCVGLEPCNLGYDTVENAAERGQRFVIKAGETWGFEIIFAVK